MKHLLIDADIVLHRATSAAEKDTRFDEDYHILMSNPTDAFNIADDMIYELMETANTNECELCFTDSNNFRKGLSESYKMHRKSSRRPLCYAEVKGMLMEKYTSQQWSNLEADDVLGIMLTRDPEKYVIWSIDKDLMQIPGNHLINDEIQFVSPETGLRFFWKQMLMGDITDGYKGCKGVGEVAASKIVGSLDLEDPWPTIVATYEKAKMTEADALYNARMAHILQDGDYDQHNGEVNLWQPPFTQPNKKVHI